MSDTKDDGRPAFPWCGDLNECPTINLGMSLRDFFAAKALPTVMKVWDEHSPIDGWDNMAAIAAVAYEMADAMLKARKA